MTQSSVEDWCARIQAKLMAALDAAWALIEASDDPDVVRKARDRAKACGELAAMARKVTAMSPRRPATSAWPAQMAEEAAAPARGLDRLKRGGRGRL